MLRTDTSSFAAGWSTPAGSSATASAAATRSPPPRRRAPQRSSATAPPMRSARRSSAPAPLMRRSVRSDGRATSPALTDPSLVPAVGSNGRPSAYKAGALPAELSGQPLFDTFQRRAPGRGSGGARAVASPCAQARRRAARSAALPAGRRFAPGAGRAPAAPRAAASLRGRLLARRRGGRGRRPPWKRRTAWGNAIPCPFSRA